MNGKVWQLDLKHGGRIPYVASLSRSVRFIKDAMTAGGNIQELVYGIVCQAETHPTLKKELLEDPRAGEGDKVMRQIDIKGKDGAVVFKTFVFWNKQHNCWHVLVALPCEDCWETGEGNLPKEQAK